MQDGDECQYLPSLKVFQTGENAIGMLVMPNHKISTFSWKQKGKNVNITTKTCSLCTESSSLQNWLLISEAETSSRIRASYWL